MSIWKTQKVPFHIHSEHANISLSGDMSAVTIPLDPPLALPKHYKATAQMFSLAANNSIKNISAALGNNAFFVTKERPPSWTVSATHLIDFKYFTGTYSDFVKARIADNTHDATSATLELASTDTLSEVVTAMNAEMGGVCVIALEVDLTADKKHAVFLKVTKGLFLMNQETGFDWISKNLETGIVIHGDERAVPIVAAGSVIVDSTVTQKVQISDPFTELTVDSNTSRNFIWGSNATPHRVTLNDGIYSVKQTGVALPAGVIDIGIAMEQLIIAVTGSTTSTQADVPGVADSITVSSDGVYVTIVLNESDDQYHLGLPGPLIRFFGVIGPRIANTGSTFPPKGTSLASNYTIPTDTGTTPRIDDFSTLQLRSGLVAALGGDGKPAAILAQFNVPAGTGVGSAFEIIPPVPMEVPCQLSNPCNELRFQLTNIRGESADMSGNRWSASILLTIYE